MIIVSPCQISDDTAEAGAAKPNSHTRMRRGSVLTSTEQDGEVLDSSLRPHNPNKSLTQATSHLQVLILKRWLDS